MGSAAAGGSAADDRCKRSVMNYFSVGGEYVDILGALILEQSVKQGECRAVLTGPL